MCLCMSMCVGVRVCVEQYIYFYNHMFFYIYKDIIYARKHNCKLRYVLVG